jgi:hypothetical protein
MAEKKKYDVYINDKLEYIDMEAKSEENAIEEAKDLFVVQSEIGQEGENTEVNLSDYTFRAVEKS